MRIPITKFNNIADDYLKGGIGEFSISKQFDILTYPDRLQPLRAMANESTPNTVIGNVIVGSGGRLYGVGTDPNNPTLGKLWVRSDNNTTASGDSYGASATWRSLTNNQLSGGIIRNVSYSDSDYPFLVDYPEAGNVRTLFWASTNLLVCSDPLGGSSTDTDSLSFSTISQGFVHPKHKKLYFGYQVGSATYIGRISTDATPFNSVNYTALQLPNNYRVFSLCDYGSYLAIGCTTANGLSSVVFLWDTDETLSGVDEVINWGAGRLKVLNNLNGVLVGVNTFSANRTDTIQDSDAIQIKMWQGGSQPEVMKEIIAQRLTTTSPSCTLFERVNFVYNNRLYFSASVVNGGTAPTYSGLWSFGKGKNGMYSLILERRATTSGNENILAAAINGDFVAMVHTANGTMANTVSGLTGAYGANSEYESSINPEMSEGDYVANKQLEAVWCSYLPLPTDGTVTFQYRVDSDKTATSGTLGAGWTTIFTESTNGEVNTERVKDSANKEFTSGRKYEFRILSTGGAVVTDWGYKYKILSTNI